MAKFLDFEPFVDDGEDFMSYVERFDHYWKVTQNKDDSLKKSAFITAIGKRLYKTLKDLLLPVKPEDKSFNEIVAVLREHSSPGSKVIAERFKFNRRYQMEGETISAFAVELRHMTARCDFGPFLDDALRDKFVAGLSDASIQASLLKKKELSFETAYNVARSAELAGKESKGFRPTSDKTFLDEDVHVIQKGQQRQKARTSAGLAAGASCYGCAEQHDAGDCPYRKARCHYCKKTGHKARACKKKNEKRLMHSTTTTKKWKYYNFFTFSKVDRRLDLTECKCALQARR
ncbi:uncharacterized protein LOC142559366 [Dermacentor variabilis]|uniref:uncharacterized protein LOC142559366 n=1 Tax=Dermacentor variabilis TaxID=34621 RepID=UPI003F5C49F9